MNGRNRAPIPPAEDTSSPYFLHPSDNPGVILVPQLLIGSNYSTWSRSFITALLAKNKLVFVDGSILRPNRDDLLYQAWFRCNSMVVAWLRNSVSAQICSSIMFLDDAYEIWSDLKDRFSLGDSARLYQLRQQLMILNQGNSDVSSYFTSLRTVWDEFKNSQPLSWCTCNRCTCNSTARWHQHQEDDCTVQFLIGLNSSFSQIRSSILAITPLPSLSKVFSLVVQEERQRRIDGNLMSSAYPPAPVTSEQPFANAASNFGRGFNKFLCSHCGKTNHNVDKCFFLHGFPPGYGRDKPKSTGSAQSSSYKHKSVNCVEDNSASSDWKGSQRFVWTFLLTQKSEVPTVMSQFFSTILTQFSKKIKMMRSDNAPEFNLTSLLSTYGTISQHSCVETPQQNARVERKHQHLLNVARSLLFQSHLPMEFWGECILTASFLINRLPSYVLPNKLTPFQLLFNKPPTYSSLKVFGCLCFASTLDKSKNKFSPTAIKCIFIGYPSGYKGYKVMDLENNNIFISRNVIFHETEFPLSHQTPSSFPDSPLPVSETTLPYTDTNLSLPLLPQQNTSQPNNIDDVSIAAPHHSASGRVIKTPTHLTDYICNSVVSTSKYPISSYFSLAKLSQPYLKFIILLSILTEPNSYKQAAQHPEWVLAMQEELQALIRTKYLVDHSVASRQDSYILQMGIQDQV